MPFIDCLRCIPDALVGYASRHETDSCEPAAILEKGALQLLAMGRTRYISLQDDGKCMVKSCKKTINREEEGMQPQALEAKVETINTATGIESAQEAAQRDLQPTQHYPCDSGGMIQYKNQRSQWPNPVSVNEDAVPHKSAALERKL